MNWDIDPLRTEEHRQSVVAKVLAWYAGSINETFDRVYGLEPNTTCKEEVVDILKDILKYIGATMEAKCSHDPIDTGFSFAYCKKCDVKMVMDNFEWKVK